ncbi:MAG: 2-dehydropantoate 2-reductase N-terminal domain-containing protein [Candidatus Hodarchaeota archaeon]
MSCAQDRTIHLCPEEDIAFLFTEVKTYDLEQACRRVAARLNLSALDSSLPQEHVTGSRILLLQNGLGNEELTSRFLPSTCIYRILTSNGAFYIEPGKVKHSGRGKTQLGRYIQTVARENFLLQMCEILTEVGIKTTHLLL